LLSGLSRCRAVVTIRYRVFHIRADNHAEINARPATDTFEFIRAMRDDRKLSANAKLVALIHASHGLTNAWVADLKGETGLSRWAYNPAKKELMEQGWFVQVCKGRGSRSKKVDAFDLYIPDFGVARSYTKEEPEDFGVANSNIAMLPGATPNGDWGSSELQQMPLILDTTEDTSSSSSLRDADPDDDEWAGPPGKTQDPQAPPPAVPGSQAAASAGAQAAVQAIPEPVIQEAAKSAVESFNSRKRGLTQSLHLGRFTQAVREACQGQDLSAWRKSLAVLPWDRNPDPEDRYSDAWTDVQVIDLVIFLGFWHGYDQITGADTNPAGYFRTALKDLVRDVMSRPHFTESAWRRAYQIPADEETELILYEAADASGKSRKFISRTPPAEYIKMVTIKLAVAADQFLEPVRFKDLPEDMQEEAIALASHAPTIRQDSTTDHPSK
jgi:hypothetical protein